MNDLLFEPSAPYASIQHARFFHLSGTCLRLLPRYVSYMKASVLDLGYTSANERLLFSGKLRPFARSTDLVMSTG